MSRCSKQEVSEIGNGPGKYGGPAEERVATDAEADRLKAAGWRELTVETLWRHDDHDRLFSVDEALAEIEPESLAGLIAERERTADADNAAVVGETTR